MCLPLLCPLPSQVGCFGCGAFLCLLHGRRVAALGRGEGRKGVQGESPGSGQGAGSERVPARAGRTAAQPALYLTMGSGELWRLAEGGQCHLPYGPADKGQPVSQSLLCWNARKGVCLGQVFVSQGISAGEINGFFCSEACEVECGQRPVPASRLLLRPARLVMGLGRLMLLRKTALSWKPSVLSRAFVFLCGLAFLNHLRPTSHSDH